jgi:hypothetical protein
MYTLHGVVDRFAPDVQEIVTPAGVKISVVNLATGELGACCIANVNMFLNPRPLNPYVFVSPDVFLGKAPVAKTHFQAGDLHYVRVNADERMCVIRDGEAILLPADDVSSRITLLYLISFYRFMFSFASQASHEPFLSLASNCRTSMRRQIRTWERTSFVPVSIWRCAVGSECSCDVYLGSLHSARADLTINMQLRFYRPF